MRNLAPDENKTYPEYTDHLALQFVSWVNVKLLLIFGCLSSSLGFNSIK